MLSLKMAKNGICLGLQANKMSFFQNKYPQNAYMPQMSRIGPILSVLAPLRFILTLIFKLNFFILDLTVHLLHLESDAK